MFRPHFSAPVNRLSFAAQPNNLKQISNCQNQKDISRLFSWGCGRTKSEPCRRQRAAGPATSPTGPLSRGASGIFSVHRLTHAKLTRARPAQLGCGSERAEGIFLGLKLIRRCAAKAGFDDLAAVKRRYFIMVVIEQIEGVRAHLEAL